MIEIRLFSPEPGILLDGEPVVVPRTDSLDLLIYTVVMNSDDYDRATLAALLFEDDSNPEKLRTAIYHLRQSLGDVIPNDARKKEPKRLRIVRDAIRLDTEDFVQRAHRLLNGVETGAAARLTEDAAEILALYRTHFLEDHYFVGHEMTAWRAERRKQLSDLRDRILGELVRLHIQQGALSDAQQTAETWLTTSLDPGSMPLQYLIWIAVSRRQFVEAQQYLVRFQQVVADGKVFFGPTPVEWRAWMHDANEPPLSLLNIPQTSALKNRVPLLTDFIVRPELARRFADLLINPERVDVIGLTGLAGAGKSSFVQSVIDTVRRVQTRFEAVWVDLNDESEIEGLLNDVLAQLGMQQLIPLDYTAKQRQFRQMVKARSAVIVIDEGVTQKFAVPEFLDSAVNLFEGTRLVLIARVLSASQFYTFDVPGFDAPDMRQFLSLHLDAEDTAALNRAEPEWFGKLAAITGGLPLALTLVLGTVTARRYGLAGFIRTMAPFAPRWTQENARQLYGRILDWSWNGLSIDEKAALYAVTMFNPANGCLVTDITAVLAQSHQVSAERVGKLVRRLTDLRLLLLSDTDNSDVRCRMHPIVYHFVQSRDEQAQRELQAGAMRAAYAGYIVSYIRANVKDFARLDAYRYEIVSMFMSSLSASAPSAIQHAVVRLFNEIYDYFDRRGLYVVTERLLTLALGLVGPNDPERVYLLCYAGQSAFKRGLHDEAHRLLTDAWELAQQHETTAVRSLILRDLGRIAHIRERHEEASDLLLRGQKAAAEEQQVVIEAQIVANLGMRSSMGQPDRARAWFRHITDDLAPRLHEEDKSGFQDVLQFVELQLGIMALQDSDYESAERHFLLSLEQARRANNPERIARTHLNLGVLNYRRRDFDAAWDYFVQGHIVAEHIQHTELLVWSIWNKGALKTIAGDYKAAARLLRAALGKANDHGIRTTTPYILTWLGIMHVCQAQYQRAQQFFVSVLRLPELPAWNIALALYGLALAARAEADLALADDAETARRQLFDVFAACGLDPAMMRSVTRRDIENAHIHLQAGLVEFPELERFHIVESIAAWLAV